MFLGTPSVTSTRKTSWLPSRFEMKAISSRAGEGQAE
jgi:hypothetical protein